MSIDQLFKNKFNDDFMFYLSKLYNYYNVNNLFDTYHQIGGEKENIIIDGIEFFVDYYENKMEDKNMIYITNVDQKNANNLYCGALSYTHKKPHILHIDVIGSPNKCVQLEKPEDSKRLVKNKIKYGDILMRLIIKIAIKNNFKSIILEDKSVFNCLNTKIPLSYNLSYVHVLTNGYPWYYKYGFILIDDLNRKIVIKNKQRMDTIKTKDVSFDSILNLIINATIKNSVLTVEKIFDITKIYIKCKDLEIYKFFYYLSRRHCDIMHYTYKLFFDLLGLMHYTIDLLDMKYDITN